MDGFSATPLRVGGLALVVGHGRPCGARWHLCSGLSGGGAALERGLPRRVACATDHPGSKGNVGIRKVLCPSCYNHRSRRLRTCICCRQQALPSCVPERCMIMGSPRAHVVASQVSWWSERYTTWTLCKWCLIRKIAALFKARSAQLDVAGIISQFCGGPSSVDFSWHQWYPSRSATSSYSSPTTRPAIQNERTVSTDGQEHQRAPGTCCRQQWRPAEGLLRFKNLDPTATRVTGQLPLITEKFHPTPPHPTSPHPLPISPHPPLSPMRCTPVFFMTRTSC